MRLYFKYFKAHLKSEMQYKLSFIMSFISQSGAALLTRVSHADVYDGADRVCHIL